MKTKILLFLFFPILSFGQWVQLGSDIDGTAANNQFGHSVSLNADGTVMAAGSPNDNSNSGYVRVYN